MHAAYFLFLIYFIEVYLIYNVVLISTIQQSDSVIHIYIYTYPFSYSFPLWFITGGCSLNICRQVDSKQGFCGND